MVKFEMLPVVKIDLDIKNPRIAKWIEMYGNAISAEQMALALGAGSSEEGYNGPSFNSLKQSIMTNGGVIHPIIVNRTANSKLTVIEGNTRTLIYKEFIRENVKGDWSSIPAMVYDNMPDERIDAIRLQAHLVGTREWDPYSKAKYLNYLRNKEHMPFSQLVDFCGGAKREVEKYIQAYNDMEEFYRPILDSDQDFDPTRFSAYVELQNPRINEAIVRGGFTKSDFSEWVHARKFSPLNTIRRLPMILSNEQSRKQFLKDGAESAIKLLDIPTAEALLKDANIFQLARELCKKISGVQFEFIKKLRQEQNIEEREIISDARDALVELYSEITPEE